MKEAIKARYEDEFGCLFYQLYEIEINLDALSGVNKKAFKDAFERGGFISSFYDNLAIVQYYGGNAEKYINDLIDYFYLSNYIIDKSLRNSIYA